MSDAKRKPMTNQEFADFVHKSTRTTARWRAQRVGPAWVRVGKEVMYRPEDVDAWLAAQRYEPVAEA